MKISRKRGSTFSRPCFGILLSLGVAIITILSPVSSTFGRCIDEPPGDLNYDCTVDMVDFSIIATNWLADYSSDPNYYPTNVIFVSESDPCAEDLSGCGRDINSPCVSIGKGIEEAVASGRTEVYVADGFYKETITLVDGISIRGGYDPCTWGSHLDTTNTIIMGDSLSLHKKTIIAENINSSTVVEGFVIYGENNYQPGANSYVVWVKDSPGLSILSNWIVAGDGADGQPGSNGSDGIAGVPGSAGSNAYDTGYGCYEECVGNGENFGGAGGQQTCGGLNVSGGNGATAYCPDFDENQNNCTECAVISYQTPPPSGQNGLNGGGAGGSSGYDAYLDGYCEGDCSCYLPPESIQAGDGSDGSDGSNGGGGSGGTGPGGSVSSNEWVGNSGSSGGDGDHGRGGGGGGAGGGVETYEYLSCPYDGASDVGGSGGGGGSGGCGGTSGYGGGAGGGSFGIFIVFSTTPVDVPVIEDNDIILGNGGSGGSGGNGGVGSVGGDGASGGAGGTGTPGSDCWCAKAGGAGGNGGDGGHGGGGGGGCGGVAYGIYAFGQGGTPPNYCEISANNEFFGGAAGQGGNGGVSIIVGNSGSDGSDGLLGSCNF